jgi:hypothetical protein
MAISSRKFGSGDISNWAPVVVDPTASVTDISIQNLSGTNSVYLSLDADWNKQFAYLATGQLISFEGLTADDAKRIFITNDGGDAEVGVIVISR